MIHWLLCVFFTSFCFFVQKNPGLEGDYTKDRHFFYKGEG